MGTISTFVLFTVIQVKVHNTKVGGVGFGCDVWKSPRFKVALAAKTCAKALERTSVR